MKKKNRFQFSIPLNRTGFNGGRTVVTPLGDLHIRYDAVDYGGEDVSERFECDLVSVEWHCHGTVLNLPIEMLNASFFDGVYEDIVNAMYNNAHEQFQDAKYPEFEYDNHD